MTVALVLATATACDGAATPVRSAPRDGQTGSCAALAHTRAGTTGAPREAEPRRAARETGHPGRAPAHWRSRGRRPRAGIPGGRSR